MIELLSLANDFFQNFAIQIMLYIHMVTVTKYNLLAIYQLKNPKENHLKSLFQ